MKLPTRTVVEIDHEEVTQRLQQGTVVYHCAYEDMKRINTYVRSRLGCGVSAKSHDKDLEGNVLSWRFNLTEVKKR